MSETENEILRSLVELEEAVKTMATANPRPDLKPIFRRLDELAAQLPKDSAADLRHYLQRKSYEKARAWLEGRRAEISAGSCGR